MCDPMTLLGTGVAIAGKFMSSASEHEGEAIRQQVFDANAAIADTNFGLLKTQAEIARGNVDVALARGRYKEGEVEAQGRKVLAAQRVYFAANNVDESYGSPLLVRAKAAGQIATDVDLVRAGAQVDAANAMTTAANLETSAAGEIGRKITAVAGSKVSQIRSDASTTAAMFGAATAFLSGVKSGGLYMPRGGGGGAAPAMARSDAFAGGEF